MTFLPNVPLTEEMCEAIGIASVEELFGDIPPAVRAKSWKLAPGQSEAEVSRFLRQALAKNTPSTVSPHFVGGTLKPHYIPAFVPRLMFRQEFYTSYTPYQAEFSQGTLQGLFEYQSLVSEVTELPTVNGSMYDYSTALGEAGLMAYRVTGRKKILVPRHWRHERQATLHNYVRGHDIALVPYEFDRAAGQANVEDVRAKVDADTAAVIVESPNLFGVLENVAALAEVAHAKQALLVQGFDLTSLGLVAPPGQSNVDIAVADGTTLALPPGGGGPQLGIFACRAGLERHMPGRIIGATKDRQGRRAFAMTLQTREQHIRRERATSNICTNETLLALGVGAHLAALGPQGLRELAALNFERANQLRDRLATEVGWKPLFAGPTYNEFVVDAPVPAETVYDAVGGKGITPGWPLGRELPDYPNALIVCSTEVHSDQDHARLVRALRGVSK